jgi:CRISPR-associated protein Cmr3
MRALVVNPIEPLSLSATPVTGIDLFSRVKGLSTPLPTTLVGALGALLGIQLSSRDSLGGLIELVNEIRQRLSCGEVIVKGPLVYFEVNSEKFIGPTIPVHPTRFYKIDCTVKSRVGYSISDECREHFEYTPGVFVGIALERRGPSGVKLVIPGFTYRYPLGFYKYVQEASSKAESKPAKPLFIYMINCEKPLKKTIVRIGGEGRVAEIYTSDEEFLIKQLNLLKSPLELAESGAYIAVSPIPLIAEKRDALYLDAVKGLEFCSSVIGVPQIGLKPPKLIVERLGLGYYEVARTRRPQILVLPPGTIVEVKSTDKSVIDVLRALYSVGFATLYPLH